MKYKYKAKLVDRKVTTTFSRVVLVTLRLISNSKSKTKSLTLKE